MSGVLSNIWRHPLKSHGREELDHANLNVAQAMPWDRHWAVLHDSSKKVTDNEGWMSCLNFSRGSKAPALMAINANFDENKKELTLSHPEIGNVRFQPNSEEGQKKFLEWVIPICPQDRALPSGIYELPERGLTDTPYASISINNHSSNRAVGQILGYEVSPLRWRGNLWFDGLAPWEEFDWIGMDLRVGSVELHVKERIERCLATTANPDTGARDADTLKALNCRGRQDFGVYAVVTKTGSITLGDRLEIL